MKFVMRIFNDARQLICFYVTHICMYFFYLVQNFIEWSNLFFPLHSVSMKSARVVSSAFIALVPTTVRLVFFLLFWNVFVSFDYNWMFNAPLRQKRTSIHTSPSSYHLHYQFTSSDKHLWKLKAVAISTGKIRTPTWAPRNDVDKLSV